MCGIAGAIGPAPLAPDRLRDALATMARRGPDAHGEWRGEIGGRHVTLLHTRLSIIDLDAAANQPFERDGRVLTYNGEIYNYLEVRAELAALGRTFRTKSDTEVLLAALSEWGAEGLKKLEGMWAFAVVDPKSGEVWLSRDRFGEKPLYTWQLGDTFYFASEVKTLAALAGRWPKVDGEQIRRYLAQGYKPLLKRPRGWFLEIEEHPAATLTVIPAVGDPTRTTFWRPLFQPRDMSYDDALAGVRDRLMTAVDLRMRADVPLAFCLSGGVDSSTLAAIAAKRLGRHIHCFSVVDDDERYDESANIADMVAALGCDHHVVRTSTEGFFERLDDLTRYHDAPVITISYYMHSFLSEAIADAGYKVSISGTAADEIFTGYYDHYPMWLAGRRADVDDATFAGLVADWRAGPGRFVNNPMLQDPMRFVRTPDARDHILLDSELFSSFLTAPFTEPWEEAALAPELLRNRMLNELLYEAVPIILHDDDRNSMRYSVENRSPFLDTDLVDFLLTVPSRHLIGDGYAKKLLRDAGDGIVPDTVRLDKRKRGFNASILSVIDRNDPATRDRLLADGPIFDIFRRDAVEGFLNGDLTSNSFSKFLFSFVAAKTFLDQQGAA